jgi:hypothetical protein
MVDPVSLTAVLDGLLAGATGAAGGAAVSSLGGLLRRAVGRKADEGEIERLLDLRQPGDAEVIAGHLVDAARDDEAFARDLQVWLSNALTLVQDDSTKNSVSGTVTGTVIQGRDFNGPINLP